MLESSFPPSSKEIESPRYAVVIPAYNEEATIYSVAQETLAHLEQLIVVDDGSTDRTSDLLQDLPVMVLHNEENRGKRLVSGRVFNSQRNRA